MIIHILVWQSQLVPGWISFYFAWHQDFNVHGSLVLAGISIMAIYYTFGWQKLSFEELLSDLLLFQPTTPAEWSGLLSFPVLTPTRSFCVQKASRAEKLWQEVFCSLPVELHGSTISQLEKDRWEDRVCGDCKASSSSWGRFWEHLVEISFFLGKYSFLQPAYIKHEIGLPSLLLTRGKLVRFMTPLMQVWRDWGGMWHSHWRSHQILWTPLRENICLLCLIHFEEPLHAGSVKDHSKYGTQFMMFNFSPHEIYVWARDAINTELFPLIFKIGSLYMWLILLNCSLKNFFYFRQ